MLDRIKQFFRASDEKQSTRTAQDKKQDVIVAICALFFEMGKIDETFTEQELEHVLAVLKTKYGLSAEDADALMDEAERELQESVDLWQFAKVINENYTVAEKETLIEQLWQIVYVDGKMDQHEHYLMNKLSTLLRLSHKQLIDAKLKVLHG